MLSDVLSWRDTAGCAAAATEDDTADCDEADFADPSEANELSFRSLVADGGEGRFRVMLKGQSSCLLEVAVGVPIPKMPVKLHKTTEYRHNKSDYPCNAGTRKLRSKS